MGRKCKTYVLYTLDDLATELHRSVSSIKTNMNELVAAGLVEKRRCDNGRANMIFVKVPVSSIASQNSTSYEAENNPSMGSKVVSYTHLGLHDAIAELVRMGAMTAKEEDSGCELCAVK